MTLPWRTKRARSSAERLLVSVRLSASMPSVGGAGPVPGPTLRGRDVVAAAFRVEEAWAGVGASVGVAGELEVVAAGAGADS